MVFVSILLAVSAQAEPSIVVPPVKDFDLAKLRPSEATCRTREPSDDIVVCAPKGMDIWLGDVSGFAGKPVRAAFTGPLNAETTLHVIQQTTPLATSPAAAFTFKWRF